MTFECGLIQPIKCKVETLNLVPAGYLGNVCHTYFLEDSLEFKPGVLVQQ